MMSKEQVGKKPCLHLLRMEDPETLKPGVNFLNPSKSTRVDNLLQDTVHTVRSDIFETGESFMSDFIGVLTKELMPAENERKFFLHVVPVGSVDLEEFITSIVGDSPGQNIELTKVPDNMLDGNDHGYVVVQYSPYISHAMIQNGGTCYYHAGFNAVLFNPYFRKHFYNTSLEETSIFTSVLALFECSKNLFNNVNPNVFLKPRNPQQERKMLGLVSRPFFQQGSDTIHYDKGLQGGGEPFDILLSILRILYNEKLQGVKVDTAFRKFVQRTGISSDWLHDFDHTVKLQEVSDDTEVVVQYPAVLGKEWIQFNGFVITSVIYVIPTTTVDYHAIAVFRDYVNGLCLVDSNHKYILPLKYVDKTLHDQFFDKTLNPSNIGEALDLLVLQAYGLDKTKRGDLSRYVIHTRAEDGSFDRDVANVSAYNGKGGGFNCKHLAILIGTVFTVCMSAFSVH